MSSHDEPHDPNTVELPEPTPWPIITAFGIALLFTGLVTDYIVSGVGFATALLGTIGWFMAVFPHSRHAWSPKVPESERAAPVKRSKRTIVHLHLGEDLHRMHVPVAVHPYSAGLLGGLAGGAAMAFFAVLYSVIFQGSPWYTANLLAASAIPDAATASVEQLKQLHPLWLFVALLAHGSLSILVGLLYTVLLPMLPARYEWFWGGIVTPLIWTALIAATMRMINPALATLVNWPSFIFCQIIFGVVGGYVVFKSRRVETMQSWPLAAKLGVEAMIKTKPK